MSEGSPDTATCATTHEHPAGSDEVTASYSGDSNYAGSSGTTGETVDEAPAITSQDSTTFTEGTAGSFTVTASGTPGPMVAESGALPNGVTFNTLTDVLSGTPTQRGTYRITFEAANGVGANAVQPFTLTVLGLHVTTTSLPAVTPGTDYGKQLEAAGGVAPYKWQLTSGSLPKGLRLSSLGLLHGTVSAKKYPHGDSFSITVTVTDHAKQATRQSATATFTVVVSEWPSVAAGPT